ncbi:MAG: tyrosine-type recombinase/integrase, partial [Bacteroidetes bacterium]|nr:tyrosine-type recombinase/integrase [Bacteroidota bacterium]
FQISADIPEEYTNPYPIYQSKRKKTSSKKKLSPAQKEAITSLEEKMILERLSQSTIKSYKQHLVSLFLFYGKLHPESITKSQLQQYLLHRIRFQKIAESTQNQIINAVKAYWERVLKRGKEWIEIPRPKKPKKLPNVISTQEVIELIDAVSNLKHKLALLLIYSAGLRKNELLNLLKKDINTKRKAIHIKAGKGKKDRYVTLAETVIPYLSQYLIQYKPARWLFEGQNGGKYSGTSLQKIFERALEKSHANPYATLHTLRHSYATHCIENGHSLKAVQEALGHGSLKTTEVYLHISSEALRKLKSPLDNLNLKK